MILPFSIKVGPIGIQITEAGNESDHRYPDRVDFELVRSCWNELKPVVDKVLEEELHKSRSNKFQHAQTRLAIEILNAMSKQAVHRKDLLSELIKTGKFARGEAEDFLNEAIKQGIIFEGENGCFASN